MIIETEKASGRLTDDELLQLAVDSSMGPVPSLTRTTTQRKRYLYLPEVAKHCANGTCQLCGIRLDYTNCNGRPFLEAHHIIPLAKDGPDEFTNMVALCPNCHRKMHVAEEVEDIETIFELVKQIQKEY